jgi:FdhE protein
MTAARGFADLRRDHPDWGASLALYEAAAAEAAARRWDAAVAPGRPAEGGRPRLEGLALSPAPDLARDWLARLAAAGGDGGEGPALARCAERVDPLALLEAAVRLDQAALARLAARAGVLEETLGAFAHLAALPLLAAAGRALLPAAAEGWTAGWCPACGAWPTLAEFRGLDQARRLRCGRCAGDWEHLWLRCPFCGNADADRLVAMVPGDDRDRRKVDTCAACRGYLKAIPTLRSLGLAEVLAADLGSVDLDLVALERGFGRPGPPPAAPLRVSLTAGAPTGAA